MVVQWRPDEEGPEKGGRVVCGGGVGAGQVELEYMVEVGILRGGYTVRPGYKGWRVTYRPCWSTATP